MTTFIIIQIEKFSQILNRLIKRFSKKISHVLFHVFQRRIFDSLRSFEQRRVSFAISKTELYHKELKSFSIFNELHQKRKNQKI